jgi:hypothetical protein
VSKASFGTADPAPLFEAVQLLEKVGCLLRRILNVARRQRLRDLVELLVQIVSRVGVAR